MVFFLIFFIIGILLIHCASVNKLKKIERGEYRYIDNEKRQEQIARTFSRQADRMSWVFKDINHDGNEELILQEFSDTDRIVGIFAMKGSDVITVLWDDIDAGSYFQLCERGLLHFNKYYGTYEFEQYILYDYDEEWNEIFVEGLELYYLFEEDEEVERTVEEHLGEQLKMEKEKVYFWEFQMWNEEKKYTKLTQEEWNEKFYDLFGKECEGYIFEYCL